MEINKLSLKKEIFDIIAFADIPKSPTMAFDHKIYTINEMKLYIYSNDHNEPHFHIKTPNYNYMVSLENRHLIKGSPLTHNQNKRLLKWFNTGGKEKLTNTWNKYNFSKNS